MFGVGCWQACSKREIKKKTRQCGASTNTKCLERLLRRSCSHSSPSAPSSCCCCSSSPHCCSGAEGGGATATAASAAATAASSAWSGRGAAVGPASAAGRPTLPCCTASEARLPAAGVPLSSLARDSSSLQSAGSTVAEQGRNLAQPSGWSCLPPVLATLAEAAATQAARCGACVPHWCQQPSHAGRAPRCAGAPTVTPPQCRQRWGAHPAAAPSTCA